MHCPLIVLTYLCIQYLGVLRNIYIYIYIFFLQKTELLIGRLLLNVRLIDTAYYSIFYHFVSSQLRIITVFSNVFNSVTGEQRIGPNDRQPIVSRKLSHEL